MVAAESDSTLGVSVPDAHDTSVRVKHVPTHVCRGVGAQPGHDRRDILGRRRVEIALPSLVIDEPVGMHLFEAGPTQEMKPRSRTGCEAIRGDAGSLVFVR